MGQILGQPCEFTFVQVPFMLQNVGGTLTRAFVAHMMSVFPTATFHAHSVRLCTTGHAIGSPVR